jgi:hypothetical protein
MPPPGLRLSSARAPMRLCGDPPTHLPADAPVPAPQAGSCCPTPERQPPPHTPRQSTKPGSSSQSPPKAGSLDRTPSQPSIAVRNLGCRNARQGVCRRTRARIGFHYVHCRSYGQGSIRSRSGLRRSPRRKGPLAGSRCRNDALRLQHHNSIEASRTATPRRCPRACAGSSANCLSGPSDRPANEVPTPRSGKDGRQICAGSGRKILQRPLA